MDRRTLLKSLGLSLAIPPFISNFREWEGADQVLQADPSDEKFWKKFRRKYYEVSTDFINLENGYFGVQARPVLEAYAANIRKVNQRSSKYMRQDFYKNDYPKIKKALSEISGADPAELLITRNATEAMNILIQGIDWKRGDEVILQYHDYHSMIETFQMLEKRKGIVLKFLDIPLLPKSREEVFFLYKNAIGSKTRGILLTHLTHLTGQVMPVKEICGFARSKGIEVMVDAAHSFAQLDYKLPDLGADFVGVNLHKWFGNPLGAGLMYVKKDRIQDLKPLYGDTRAKEDSIYKLGHFGTPAAPVVMTIAAAAAFWKVLDPKSKEARLRHLQHYWTHQARSMDRVEVLTPADETQACALASFKIEGVTASEVVRRLDQEFGVFTVIRRLHRDTVVRVTPNLYNGVGDLDRLLEVIEQVAKK